MSVVSYKLVYTYKNIYLYGLNQPFNRASDSESSSRKIQTDVMPLIESY